MKYETSKSSGLDRKTLRKLEAIAMACCYSLEDRGGIDGRGGDSVDFVDVSVLSIQAMLERAYLLGKEDASK